MTKKRTSKYIHTAFFMLLFSLAFTVNAFGAPASSQSPNDRRVLESETRESGVRINDTISRNETLNNTRATPATPPPSQPAPPSNAPLSPLPPLSGNQTR